MTKIETHTQQSGHVIVTARVGTCVLRVFGWRHRRAYIELVKALAHTKKLSGADDNDDDVLRARLLASESVSDEHRAVSSP